MYLGWKTLETVVNSCEWEIDGLTRLILKKSAICAAIESSIATDDGVKLNERPEEVGAKSVQFTAQHKRAIDASVDLSLLFALSQHSIIPIFSE